MIDLKGLPAVDRVERGLHDMAKAHWSAEALLLASAPDLLRDLGLPIASEVDLPCDPELRLYETLGRQSADPYGRYNALRRDLDSFIRCLQARRRRAAIKHAGG